MNTRTAEATIKGYYYQFDSTILNLLKLSDDKDTVIVEGIEDIDIVTATEKTAVQCKYLSKPKFSNSAIRKPIMLMLDHFISSAKVSNIQYVLYAHFEEETAGNEPHIDLIKIKDILTYKEKKTEKKYYVERGITDTQLESFLRKFKFVFGNEFSSQQKEVIRLLQKMFKCNEYEADIHFYNNAMRVVLDLSIKKKSSERTISKTDFIKKIDCREKLFNDWFILLRSKNEYLKLASNSLKSTKALLPSRSKILVIGSEVLLADNSNLPLVSFVENLIEHYFKEGSAFNNAKPLTLVLDCDTSYLHKVKSELIDKNILFNDGYEQVKFSSYVFNAEPIKNTNKAGTKIIKSSFLLKILSKSTFVDNISSIVKPDTLMVFSKDNQRVKFESSQHFDFKYCDNLSDIYFLLKP